MSVFNFQGEIYFECDECGEESSGFDFEDALANIKTEGWKIEKIEGEWKHTCPVCREKNG